MPYITTNRFSPSCDSDCLNVAIEGVQKGDFLAIRQALLAATSYSVLDITGDTTRFTARLSNREVTFVWKTKHRSKNS